MLYFTWYTSGSCSEACFLYHPFIIFVILCPLLVQANDCRSSHLYVTMAAVVSSLCRNHGAGAFSTSVTIFLRKCKRHLRFISLKSYISFLVSSASTLDLICICGTTAIKATTSGLCLVVVDEHKIDGWILLFDCLWIWFWNLILRLDQVFRTSTSVFRASDT
jgi:hypothetical protein